MMGLALTLAWTPLAPAIACLQALHRDVRRVARLDAARDLESLDNELWWRNSTSRLPDAHRVLIGGRRLATSDSLSYRVRNSPFSRKVFRGS
jgi:hypothetical protein